MHTTFEIQKQGLKFLFWNVGRLLAGVIFNSFKIKKNKFKEIYNNENFTCNNFHPILTKIVLFLRLKRDVNQAVN